jgi:hypothetical protein
MKNSLKNGPNYKRIYAEIAKEIELYDQEYLTILGLGSFADFILHLENSVNQAKVHWTSGRQNSALIHMKSIAAISTLCLKKIGLPDEPNRARRAKLPTPEEAEKYLKDYVANQKK